MKILYSPFFFYILLFLLSRGHKNEKWHSHLFCKFLFIHMIHFFVCLKRVMENALLSAV